MRSMLSISTLKKQYTNYLRPIRGTVTRSLLRQARLSSDIAGPRLPPTNEPKPTSDSCENEEEYFRYTGGRWLWNEEQQLRERYKAFNVAELKRIAISTAQAKSCISFSKIGEGSYNKIFRLSMDNGVSVVARVPNPNTGPERLCTSSEVATMDLARNFLGIPLPKIYTWDSNPNNDVGSEYIIMEEAKGSNLSQTWGTMSLEERVSIVSQIVSIESKLVGLSFSHYGSLFYADENIAGSERIKVNIDGSLSEDCRTQIEDRFIMGPMVKREYWDDGRSNMDIDRGPWATAEAFVRAPAIREIDWISKYASPMLPSDPLYTSAAQNSPTAHTSLLKRYLDVCHWLLPDNEDMISARLWHRDLHAGNLFVSDGQITSLIDWQASTIEPFFLLARHPRLVAYSGELLLRLPEDFSKLEQEQRVALEEQVQDSIAVFTYENQTAKYNPLLHTFLHLSYGKIRTETINFAGKTWTDDIRPLRECLIRVERDWEHISTHRPCPIHFTTEEIQSHREDGAGWNDVQDFWDSVDGLISRDGWTPNENYLEALEFFQELRKQGLQNMVGAERDEFETQTKWAEETK